MKIFNKDIILNDDLMPKHIAMIMDGNGRWAKRRGLPRTAGHKVGAERIFDLVNYCVKSKIEVITVFAFSTENWKRDKKEIDYIFSLLEGSFVERLEELKKANVRVIVSGSLDRLVGEYDSLKEKIEKIIEETKDNSELTLNVAFNYGGHDEIIRATKKICEEVNNKAISINDINENLFENYLFTKGLPPVDLLIRTSGEQRISNFLLWQIAYAEFIFTDVMWPDFNENELKKCIYEYQRRDRRFGNVK